MPVEAKGECCLRYGQASYLQGKHDGLMEASKASKVWWYDFYNEMFADRPIRHLKGVRDTLEFTCNRLSKNFELEAQTIKRSMP